MFSNRTTVIWESKTNLVGLHQTYTVLLMEPMPIGVNKEVVFLQSPLSYFFGEWSRPFSRRIGLS